MPVIIIDVIFVHFVLTHTKNEHAPLESVSTKLIIYNGYNDRFISFLLFRWS